MPLRFVMSDATRLPCIDGMSMCMCMCRTLPEERPREARIGP